MNLAKSRNGLMLPEFDRRSPNLITAFWVNDDRSRVAGTFWQRLSKRRLNMGKYWEVFRADRFSPARLAWA